MSPTIFPNTAFIKLHILDLVLHIIISHFIISHQARQNNRAGAKIGKFSCQKAESRHKKIPQTSDFPGFGGF
jgi:hypothetical protein